MAEPRCLDCGYILRGLPDARCPECGRAFDLAIPSTYTTKPPFDRFRFWLPAFLLALGLGLVLYPLLIYFTGFGWTVSLLLPTCLGSVIGFGCRVRRLNQVLLCIIVLGAIITALMTMNILGAFCGLTLAGVALGPLMLGTLFGWLLRLLMKSSDWDQRWHLPTLLLLFFLLLGAAVESRFSRTFSDETVSTTIVLPASVDRAWESLMFYEEIKGRPPFLMRFVLPHPLYTRGSIGQVGDEKVCVYSHGLLVKRITQRVPDERLSFNVVEQKNIENRSVVLKGGSFEFLALSSGQTRVTLSTTYQPLLGPRWAWRWAERLGVHTLHEYVLQGMRIKLADSAAASRESKIGTGS